jgi:hypothetical protein
MQPDLSVHDNQVYALVVDFDGRRVVLHTTYRGTEPPEFTDVVFQDVLTHYFEHALPGNILYDVEEVGIDQFVLGNGPLFETSWRYAWPPIEYGGNLDTLAAGLAARSTRAYSISSSYGLSGWVLAGSCERRPRQKPATPF